MPWCSPGQASTSDPLLFGLGTLYANISHSEQACAELSTAISLYRAMDMTLWLPQAEAALAQVEGR